MTQYGIDEGLVEMDVFGENNPEYKAATVLETVDRVLNTALFRNIYGLPVNWAAMEVL